MHRGMLPERLFLGCGTREYSATRDHDRDDVDALLLGYCQEAASALESQVGVLVVACRGLVGGAGVRAIGARGVNRKKDFLSAR